MVLWLMILCVLVEAIWVFEYIGDNFENLKNAVPEPCIVSVQMGEEQQKNFRVEN